MESWVWVWVLSMWNGCQLLFHLGSQLTRPQLSLPTVPHDSLTNYVHVHWYPLSCSRDAGLYRYQFHLLGSCHIRWALKICSISRLSWFFLTFTFRYNFSISLSVNAKNSTLGFWCGLHWTCSSVCERSQLYHIEFSSSYMIYLLRFLGSFLEHFIVFSVEWPCAVFIIVIAVMVIVIILFS